MKISYNWLLDYIQTDLSIDKISDILTDIGLEVEGTEMIGTSEEDLKNFVVGKVLTCEKHPNADKLKLTTVDIGNEVVQIVCGAPNVDVGQHVPVAKVGAILKDNKGNTFQIKKAKLRGEASHGMICSKKELGISNDHEGIWVMETNASAGTPLADILETDTDTVFEIGLTPNRADAMSHYGVARDLYAALKSRNIDANFLRPKVPEVQSSNTDNPITVDIQDVEKCPRFTGVYLENVTVKDSPDWLQSRLISMGLAPVNNIVDITNYILHGVGQPMHAYDADKIKGNKIIVKSESKSAHKITTLDKETRELRGDELLICDTQEPIGIAGVMGGLDSSVTHKTKNIFLESAYFQPVSIRKTSKYHNINSASSFRFERGIDPNFCLNALKIAIGLVQELASGTVVGSVIDHYPTPIDNHSALLQYRNVDRLIGERLHRDKIKDILELLEIDVISESNNVLELDIPAYRVDVTREADLVEEILRIYGYNAISAPEKLSFAIVSGNGYRDELVDHTLSEVLVSNGFHEAMNLSMYKDEYNQWLGLDKQESVEILNSLSTDLSVLRRSMLPGLLQNIDYNIKRKQDSIKLFELGSCYERNDKGFTETRKLSIAVSGKWQPDNWSVPTQDVNLDHLKGILALVFKRFGLDSYKIEESNNSFETFGLNYKVKDTTIAHICKISSDLTKKFDVDKDVYFAEILLNNFKNCYFEKDKMQFVELSKFPSVKRDLALLLSKDISYQDVEKTVKSVNNKYIKQVNLFDVYEGDKLPADKKSYAISIDLEDREKTMNDKQIDKLMNKIVASLKQNLKAELRN